MNASLPFRMNFPHFVQKKRQVTKTSIACDRCKTQKLRCDELVPCTRCLKRGRHDECTRRGELVTCVMPSWNSSLPSSHKTAVRVSSNPPEPNPLVQPKQVCRKCGKAAQCFHQLLCGSCAEAGDNCKLCEEELEKAMTEHLLLDVDEVSTPMKQSDLSSLDFTSDAQPLMDLTRSELVDREDGMHDLSLWDTDPQDLFVSSFLAGHEVASFNGLDYLQLINNEDWLDFSSN